MDNRQVAHAQPIPPTAPPGTDGRATASSESVANAAVNTGAETITNQQLLDAFGSAATDLGLANPWALLQKADLSLFDLAQDPHAVYAGPPLDQLPNLSDTERAHIHARLSPRAHVASPRAGDADPTPERIFTPWTGVVTAPAGLHLRRGPGTQHDILRVLPLGTTVDVLAERGDWLNVMAAEQMGFLHGAYIAPQTDVPAEQGADDGQLSLPPDADAGAASVVRTWNQYGEMLTAYAAEHDIDPDVFVAVFAAESGGEAFGPDGRLLIRFETHIFQREWGARHPEQFARHFRFNPERPWVVQQWRAAPAEAWQPCHSDQSAEWRVFNFACTLDETAAMRSISMGAPQIMGFNHREAGYETVRTMFHAFAAEAEHQVRAFFAFLEAKRALRALQRGDLHMFAAIYNGPGQAAEYARIIRERLAAFWQVRAAARTATAGTRRLPTAPVSSQSSVEQAGVAHAAPRAPTGAVQRLPAPFTPAAQTLSEMDPELYARWREHVSQGFENNNQMFQRILNGFMDPYYTTIRMNRILFGVGIASFIAAAALSIWTQDVLFSLVFNGLSAVAFASYFLSRPTQSLEENLQFITWLGIIYNTYWTRLAYALDLKTVQDDIEDATQDAINEIQTLVAQHAERAGKRPNLRPDE